MQIRCGYKIAYDCPAPTPLLMMLSVHPSRFEDLQTPQTMHADPAAEIKEYKDGFGNICHRVLAPPGRITFTADFVVEDSGQLDPRDDQAGQFLVQDLPDETLVFLLGSRYCETERLSDTAWSLFGSATPGMPRVQAILDYTHSHMTFGYEFARSDKTAWDAYQERRGVCRDFAHLAVTFCRCMNIPARYCTGYLGDIGVPLSGFADGFQRLVRRLFGRAEWRAVVHLRRAAQRAPHRPRAAGPAGGTPRTWRSPRISARRGWRSSRWSRTRLGRVYSGPPPPPTPSLKGRGLRTW